MNEVLLALKVTIFPPFRILRETKRAEEVISNCREVLLMLMGWNEMKRSNPHFFTFYWISFKSYRKTLPLSEFRVVNTLFVLWINYSVGIKSNNFSEDLYDFNQFQKLIGKSAAVRVESSESTLSTSEKFQFSISAPKLDETTSQKPRQLFHFEFFMSRHSSFFSTFPASVKTWDCENFVVNLSPFPPDWARNEAAIWS